MDWKNIIIWMRFGALIPAAVMGFLAVLVGMHKFQYVIERMFCSHEFFQSDKCIAPGWHGELFLIAGAALAPVVFITFGVLMAPQARAVIAWMLFVLGGVLAYKLLLKSPDEAILPVVVYTSGFCAASVWFWRTKNKNFES